MDWADYWNSSKRQNCFRRRHTLPAALQLESRPRRISCSWRYSFSVTRGLECPCNFLASSGQDCIGNLNVGFVPESDRSPVIDTAVLRRRSSVKMEGMETYWSSQSPSSKSRNSGLYRDLDDVPSFQLPPDCGHGLSPCTRARDKLDSTQFQEPDGPITGEISPNRVTPGSNERPLWARKRTFRSGFSEASRERPLWVESGHSTFYAATQHELPL